MKTPPPTHLAKFKDWIIKHDGKAAGTANIYARFLTRCAKHYETSINEQTVKSDADVQRIIRDVSKVVEQRGRWAEGTFNRHDIPDNLTPALKAYARFIQDTFSYPTASANADALREGSNGVDYRKVITIEPGKRGGKPCVRGMRITVSDVLGWLASGMSHDEIRSDFPELTESDIRACLAFAAEKELHAVSVA